LFLIVGRIYINQNTIIAVTEDPANVDYKLHLAELYDAAGDEDKAKDLIEDGKQILFLCV
jgi:aromatic ring hydroxylase